MGRKSLVRSNALLLLFRIGVGLLNVLPMQAIVKTFFPLQIVSDKVATITFTKGEEKHPLALPYLTLAELPEFRISFDLLDSEPQSIHYRLEHCDAHWNLSPYLTSSDYITGFTTGILPQEGEASTLTKVAYRHYELCFSQEVSSLPKISGNYRITFFCAGMEQSPLLIASFAIVEPSVKISPLDFPYRSGSDKQCLEIELADTATDRNYSGEPFLVLVAQNGRRDNVLSPLQPSDVSVGKQRFLREDLCFDGGNEYNAFEYLGREVAAMGVEHVEESEAITELYLYPDYNRAGKPYLSTEEGQMGQYIITNRGMLSNPDISTDYYYVHFTLKSEPLSQGYVPLLIGAAFEALPIAERIMNYNAHLQAYTATLLLKGGYVSYSYAAAPMSLESPFTMQYTEGNHEETSNTYTYFVYQPSHFERYDRLVGVLQQTR